MVSASRRAPSSPPPPPLSRWQSQSSFSSSATTGNLPLPILHPLLHPRLHPRSHRIDHESEAVESGLEEYRRQKNARSIDGLPTGILEASEPCPDCEGAAVGPVSHPSAESSKIEP